MQLSPSAGHPYRTLANKIAKQIRDGVLKPDDQLPPVRQLARDSNVTVATAQRAVHELVAEGYVKTVPGHGVFVLLQTEDGPDDAGLPGRIEQLERELASLRDRVARLEQGTASG